MRIHTSTSFLGRIAASFPPPRFLDVAAAGIDISDSSIKVVVLSRKRFGFIPSVVDERPLPEGSIVGGVIENTTQVVETLKELKRAHNLGFVRVSLPEEKAYLFQANLPFTSNREQMLHSVEFQLEENVPIAPSEAVFDYDIISKEKEGDVGVSVTVFQRAVIGVYQEIIAQAGLVPLSLELEGQAMADALIPQGDSSTYMIVDFGRTRSGLSIVQNGVVGFASAVDVGGRELVEAVTKRFDISTKEAVALKDEKGLVRTEENKELYDSLMTTISALRDEINRHCAFWDSQVEERGEVQAKVTKVILCGGNASLPGLVETLASGLAVPVQLGDVWVNLFSVDDFIPTVDYETSLRYATAVGLAIG